MSKPYVEFQKARLGYGSRTILTDVDLKLCEGDFLGIVGPNGSGKTTLLRTLLGILPVLAGGRRYGDGARPRFGYVPQREALDVLYPFTVREVVTMGRYHMKGLLRPFNAQDRARIDWSMARAGVEGFAHRQYRDLSGGQKQRTLIARALALEPQVLVLDEPTAGMDLLSSQLLMELVSNLHDEGHLTVVLVTHLLGEVANCAQSIAIVDRGRAIEGPTDTMLTSASLSEMYGVPVEVGTVAGQRVIVPAPRTGESSHV